MLKAIVCGLPPSAVDYIRAAVSEAFGEGSVDIETVSLNNLVLQCRLAFQDPSVVLVSLDNVSESNFRSSDNGLLSDDKYFVYNSDAALVATLNVRLGTNLALLEINSLGGVFEFSEESESSTEVSSFTEKYIEQLKAQVQEAEARLLEFAPTVDNSAEILELKDQLNGVLTSKEESDRLLSEIQTRHGECTEQVQVLNQEKMFLERDLREATSELSNLQLRYSEQSSLYSDRAKQVEQLNERLVKVQDLLETAKADVLAYKSLASKGTEAEARLKVLQELYDAAQLQLAGGTADDWNAERTSLNSRVLELEGEKAAAKSAKDVLGDRIAELDKENEDLNQVLQQRDQRIAKDGQTLLELNQLVQSAGISGAVISAEIPNSELVQVSAELSRLSDSPFGKLAAVSTPFSPVTMQLVPKTRFNNIEFIFMGNNASQKGVYRYLEEKLKMSAIDLSPSSPGAPFRNFDPNRPTLLVDVVSETHIDYCFFVGSMVPGVKWFAEGGSIASYLSNARNPKVKILSPGVQYLNDAYFLDIRWEQRLNELERSGYNVLIVAGSIANVVSRVLYESFADLAPTQVVSMGTPTALRNMAGSLKGMKNGSDSHVVLFDYKQQPPKFRNQIPGSHRVFVENAQWLRREI